MQQAREWIESGIDACISINVSVLQLQQDSFVDGLRAAAARHCYIPGSIRLELTESLMMSNPELTLATMNLLRSEGFRLSLDDFGTGYSSLSYLSRLPFDELKIDRSFVKRVIGDPTVAAIVRAIIALGHALSIDVIAEGVETDAEASFLRDLGCDQFQGYLYGKAVPAEQFVDRWRASSRLAICPA